jgi:hypothetical protein
MRIFKRNREKRPMAGAVSTAGLVGTDPVPLPGNPFGALRLVDRPSLPASTEQALETARGAVKDRAERSRAEIADLVAEERAQVAALVAETVKESEDRIREVAEAGQVEAAELTNAREMEERLRKEISETVKREVAKTIGQLRPKTSKAKPAPKAGKGSARNGAGRRRKTNASSNGRPKTAV